MSATSPGAPTWAVIAGGGTAGHLLPGLAVARELVERGHVPSSLHFVGAERGIEAELVPAAGFDITLLPGRGVQRRLTLDNVGALVGLARAAVQAVGLVRRRRPAVVLALGGFASAAVAVAAVLWRVPLVIAEQNARAGAANRLVARFAAACAVPFTETDLPRATVTGNPVRPEILEVAAHPDRIAARRELGLPEDRTVLVAFAGSLGSRRLNQAVQGAVSTWSDRPDLAIYHVVGARDWDDRPELAPEQLQYRAVRYESRMELALAAADLAVCRSGGTTVAELAVIGVPSVLVPLPIATRDHQRANAGPLVRAGAAVMVDDAELDAARLVAEVDRILDGGPQRLADMSHAARSLGRPDAAQAVTDLVEAAAARSGS
jgi:undecaprenyldiphospho-muramoylpentapeptide beta-N-acetylglucosaminyltransferase